MKVLVCDYQGQISAVVATAAQIGLDQPWQIVPQRGAPVADTADVNASNTSSRQTDSGPSYVASFREHLCAGLADRYTMAILTLSPPVRTRIYTTPRDVLFGPVQGRRVGRPGDSPRGWGLCTALFESFFPERSA